jgi:AhpD family alkylhydroperoxidase
MSEHFYHSAGLSSIAKLFELKGETAGALMAFDKSAFTDGAISVKNKELIAIGAAHVTQCPYCIDGHVKRALAAGASEEEVAEAVLVGVAMNAGAALAHSSIAMTALDNAKKETD